MIVLYNIFYLIILIKMPIDNPEESTEQGEAAQEEEVTDEMAKQIVDWPQVDEEIARNISETINSIYKKLTKLSEEIKGHFPEKILDAIKERAKENKLTKEEINKLKDIVKIIVDKGHITQKEVEELEKISWLSEEELVIIRWETPIKIPVQVEDINPHGGSITDSQNSWQNYENNSYQITQKEIQTEENAHQEYTSTSPEREEIDMETINTEVQELFNTINDIKYTDKDWTIYEIFKTKDEDSSCITIKKIFPDQTKTYYDFVYRDWEYKVFYAVNPEGEDYPEPKILKNPKNIQIQINAINACYQKAIKTEESEESEEDAAALEAIKFTKNKDQDNPDIQNA